MSDEIILKATREGFGEGILVAGKADKNIVALCAGLIDSCKLNAFIEALPDQFIETGVAEQNMMGIAAGLALSGKIPFTCSFAVFSPARSWDQLRVSVCYSKANVKIAGHHTGLTVGEDGASHQALEDIAITRVLPNMTVLVPADFNQAKQMTITVAKYDGPVYMRFNREKSPVFTPADEPFRIGKAQVLKVGNDISVIACGLMVWEALQAATELETQGISCEVINCSSIKPLDEATILSSVEKTKKVVTVEEHQVAGGMGSVIAELLSEKLPTQILRIGMNDQFGESGTAKGLLEKYGFSSEKLAQRIKKFVK